MVDPNTQYQFRIQLSRAPSCHCINAECFTNQTISSGRGSWYHEKSNQTIAVPDASCLVLSVSKVIDDKAAQNDEHFVVSPNPETSKESTCIMTCM